MKFPKQLYNGYRAIVNCRLIKSQDYSPQALREFETILNDCQPLTEHMERFNTVKDFYNTNKYNYQKFIRGTQLECTILWTESKSIVNWFQLRGVIYLSYDYRDNQYRVELHRNLDTNRAVTDLKRDDGHVVDLRLEEFPTLNNLSI